MDRTILFVACANKLFLILANYSPIVNYFPYALQGSWGGARKLQKKPHTIHFNGIIGMSPFSRFWGDWMFIRPMCGLSDPWLFWGNSRSPGKYLLPLWRIFMQFRSFGRTGWQVSAVSFGAWAIGGDWGGVSDQESLAALHTALDQGINFFDSADVYGDGRSERLLARLKKERPGEFYIVTKAGRRLNPHVADGYNRENLTRFIERSLKNLETDTLDLVQLHCPPTEVYYRPEVFAVLDDLVTQGKLKHYGVSVEKVEEAIKALEYPNLQSVQIIFNIFRQRPADLFFELAKNRQVAILARVPLSSGMLTGKLSRDTQFSQNDHRAYNRQGEAFDKGETFSGVDYQTGLDVVEELRPLVPAGWTMAQFALRWILMFDAVSCAIPGGKRPEQVIDNARAADLPPISESTMTAIQQIYDQRIKEQVHHYW
jgi:aryl-alcohol dehydrogenase-like predicted oxidoreductase